MQKQAHVNVYSLAHVNVYSLAILNTSVLCFSFLMLCPGVLAALPKTRRAPGLHCPSVHCAVLLLSWMCPVGNPYTESTGPPLGQRA